MEMVKTKISFQKYPVYKDSGAEWLGQIPEGWELRRFKYLFNEINERSEDGNGALLAVSQYTGVTKKSDKLGAGELLTTASTLEGYKKVYQNDLVSNIMLAWNGSLGFSPYNGITSPAYSVYRLNQGNSMRFFHYLVRSQVYKAEFKRNSSGVIESRLRLYTEDFFNIQSLLPSLKEQTAIANFLDDKTAKIDKAIAQKEKMIDLLKERKQIIIQNAVTKGLDPNVKMKDSGVEWIGEIPEHWEVKKVKNFLVDSYSGGTPSTDKAEYWDGGVKWISSVDVKTDLIVDTKRTISELGMKKSSSNVVPSGSVIIVTRSGILQHTLPVALVSENMAINQDIKCFILKDKYISPSYFQTFIQGKNHEVLIETRKQGATVESIEMEYFHELSIALPSISEQISIKNYIEKLSSKFRQSISLQKKQIDKLIEYKATLIDSAVTGKIKVN